MAGANGRMSYAPDAQVVTDDRTRLQRYNERFDQAWSARRSFEARWRTLGEYYLPTRPRFSISDSNKGDRSNNKILDPTGTQSVEIATAGLLAMMASPARPWFVYGLPLSRTERSTGINRWLTAARDETLNVLERSNFYTALAELIRDELIFATGAMAIYDDWQRIVRCHTFPVGSFAIDQDSMGRVDYFCREVTMSVRQVVQTYGFDNCSRQVQLDFMQKGQNNAVVVRSHIQRNESPDEGRARYDAKYLPWSECIWEKQATAAVLPEQEKFLRESGFHEFPIIVGRWQRNDEDTYGTGSPGITALGTVKMLQAMSRDYLNALKKSIDPPLVGGTSFLNRPVSLIHGEVTVEDETQGKGLRPIHEVRTPFGEVTAEIERRRLEVENIFMVRLFLMWTTDTRAQPPTAAEVYARDREKLILGPTQERHGDEVLGKAIERVLNIMIRRSQPAWSVGEDGIIPTVPDELEGADVRPEYISEAATAQKVVGISAIERHAGFGAQQAQFFGPSILDNINGDKMMAAHADMLSVPPDVSTSESERAELREQRRKAEAAQRAAEALPAMAKAAKDLGTTPMDEDTALTSLVGGGS